MRVGSVASSAATLTVRLSAAPGDFDGDGKSDVTIFRPSRTPGTSCGRARTSRPTARMCGGPPATSRCVVISTATARPTSRSTAPRRASGTSCNRVPSYTTYVSYSWGLPGDIPEPEDYDGDGKSRHRRVSALDRCLVRPAVEYRLHDVCEPGVGPHRR